MSSRWRAIVLIGTFAVTAVVANVPASARADTIVATLDRFGGLSVHGSAVAWSTFDGTKRRYTLSILQNGKVTTAAVPGRSVPFDVDLGRDHRGRLVAVYSRCTSEGGPSSPFTELDVATPGRGCRIYRHIVGRRGEQRLRQIGAAGASDYMPTLSGSRIAFARRLRGGRLSLQVRRLSGTLERTLRSRTGEGDARVTGIDLAARTVAYGWRYERQECPKDLSGGEEKTYLESEIWAERIGRRGRHRVARACDTASVISVTSPSASTSAVGYLEHHRTQAGDPSSSFLGRRRRITGSNSDIAKRSLEADGRVLRWAGNFFLREQVRYGGIVYEVVRLD